MIFVLDIGNTNMVLGVFQNDTLQYEWRVKTDRYKTEDEFAMLIKSLFDYRGISFRVIEGITISSVVPPIMRSIKNMCKSYFNLEPLIIEKDNAESFLTITYPHPNEIGADRIVNAVGAITIYGGPLVIIDFGTATTYCYINEKNEYVGGIISPGLKTSLEALYNKASKLPKIEVKPPRNVIGSSTVEAMESGVFYGSVGQVEGMLKRIHGAMDTEFTVVATGGLASLMAEGTELIDIVDTHLTLKGLYEIYQKNNE